VITKSSVDGFGWIDRRPAGVAEGGVLLLRRVEADDGAWWDFTTETLPLPGAFTKVDPPSGATGQPTELTLSWATSANATGYEVCVDTVDNGSCDATWNALGDVTSADVDGLAEWTSYFWQVRAVNGNGSTEADGGTWWWFITTPYLFGDGFEWGDTSAWSQSGP